MKNIEILITLDGMPMLSAQHGQCASQFMQIANVKVEKLHHFAPSSTNPSSWNWFLILNTVCHIDDDISTWTLHRRLSLQQISI